MTRVLVATVGLPASGKTTWARERVATWGVHQAARLNRDDLRAMMHNGAYQGAGTESQVTAAQRAAIVAVWCTGTPVVICDDTNLNPGTLDELRTLAESNGAEFRIKSFLDVPLAICLERNAMRTGAARLPEGRIAAMYEQLGPIRAVLAEAGA